MRTLHDCDILHGDLQLANIMIHDRHVTLMDFDWSCVCTDEEEKAKELEELVNLLAEIV